MSNNDPDSQNSGEEGGGLAANSIPGGPMDMNSENGAEPMSPDDTGTATGADEDPSYASVRPTGGSIDRDTGA